ncbi:MAG: sterol desaturase family protein [Oceanospirillaceae bacterium]|nr:sterol desaturase family protein [Oceanospirillaceae bacterium]MCP5334601.1 sterol desaturase family protein [Oceanospirillaceae bacterium]
MAPLDFAGLWQAALQSYHDPLFIPLVVGSTLLSAAAFLCFALPWTLLAFIDPIKLRRFKIQQKPFQVRTYFWPNIARITINSSIMLSLMVLAWPLFRELNTIHVGELPAWYWVVLQLLIFIVLDDFLYYWMHRAMHHPLLLRHVHVVHHRIKNTCALDGNYFHWLEFVATGLLTMRGPVNTN